MPPWSLSGDPLHPRRSVQRSDEGLDTRARGAGWTGPQEHQLRPGSSEQRGTMGRAGQRSPVQKGRKGQTPKGTGLDGLKDTGQ